MTELQWLLDLSEHTRVTLREEVAETLGVDRHTTVGEIREMIQPKPIQIETMIEIDTDLNTEF
jgi:hypothetical protein